jgi:hypothetical protein
LKVLKVSYNACFRISKDSKKYYTRRGVMPITIAKYTFDGPYTSVDKLEDRSGVYAIICQKEGKNYLIDVGESSTMKSRVKTHDRKDCWEENCEGTLAVAVYYTPNSQQPGRMAIEQEIRDQYDVPCGER